MKKTKIENSQLMVASCKFHFQHIRLACSGLVEARSRESNCVFLNSRLGCIIYWRRYRFFNVTKTTQQYNKLFERKGFFIRVMRNLRTVQKVAQLSFIPKGSSGFTQRHRLIWHVSLLTIKFCLTLAAVLYFQTWVCNSDSLSGNNGESSALSPPSLFAVTKLLC